MTLIAQDATSTAWWYEAVHTLGFPIVLLILIGLGLWKAGRYLGERLFHDEKGLATRVVDRHIKFVDVMEEKQLQLADSVEQIGEAAKIAREQLLVIGGSRDNLHRAAVHAVDYLEEVAKSLSIEKEAKPHLDAIRRELQSSS